MTYSGWSIAVSLLISATSATTWMTYSGWSVAVSLLISATSAVT